MLPGKMLVIQDKEKDIKRFRQLVDKSFPLISVALPLAVEEAEVVGDVLMKARPWDAMLMV